ncbi:hypothetical protein WJX72_004720 [[Myrmecia] bisecta]|uniref:Reverse transcriptase domain-containing protein n=1 Tax=[Myrmecia] bisecta TaxID=41462 RepID=A0AAW1QF49_9CHLO
MVTALRGLFKIMTTAECVPDMWREGVIVNLFKNGDKKDMGNYRGITLMSVVGKLYCKVINYRIVKLERLEDDNIIHEGQAGFRQGAAQGCPLSPTLYSVYVNGMLEEVSNTGRGIKVGDHVIPATMFADDFKGMEETPGKLQEIIDVCTSYANRYRFQANVSKSAVMMYGPAEPTTPDMQLKWGTQTIPEVDQYAYLDLEFTADGKWDAHIAKLVQKGKTRTNMLTKFFKNSVLNADVKTVVLKTVLRPLFEYGAETLYRSCVRASSSKKEDAAGSKDGKKPGGGRRSWWPALLGIAKDHKPKEGVKRKEYTPDITVATDWEAPPAAPSSGSDAGAWDVEADAEPKADPVGYAIMFVMVLAAIWLTTSLFRGAGSLYRRRAARQPVGAQPAMVVQQGRSAAADSAKDNEQPQTGAGQSALAAPTLERDAAASHRGGEDGNTPSAQALNWGEDYADVKADDQEPTGSVSEEAGAGDARAGNTDERGAHSKDGEQRQEEGKHFEDADAEEHTYQHDATSGSDSDMEPSAFQAADAYQSASSDAHDQYSRQLAERAERAGASSVGTESADEAGAAQQAQQGQQAADSQQAEADQADLDRDLAWYEQDPGPSAAAALPEIQESDVEPLQNAVDPASVRFEESASVKTLRHRMSVALRSTQAASEAAERAASYSNTATVAAEHASQAAERATSALARVHTSLETVSDANIRQVEARLQAAEGRVREAEAAAQQAERNAGRAAAIAAAHEQRAASQAAVAEKAADVDVSNVEAQSESKRPRSTSDQGQGCKRTKPASRCSVVTTDESLKRDIEDSHSSTAKEALVVIVGGDEQQYLEAARLTGVECIDICTLKGNSERCLALVNLKTHFWFSAKALTMLPLLSWLSNTKVEPRKVTRVCQLLHRRLLLAG